MRALVILILLAAVGLVAWLFLGGGETPERGDRLVTAPEERNATTKPPEPDAVDAETAGTFLEGILLNEERVPLAGGRITARAFERTTWSFRELGLEARSDPEGRFRIRVDTESWVVVRAHHPGYQRGERYATAHQEKPLEIILRKGAPVTVVVTNPDLEPVAEAKVTLFDREQGESLDEVLTDADGRVLAGVVAPGRVLVTVNHPGYALSKDDHVIEGLDPAEVEVRLDRGGAVEGRVLSPDGEPVPGARVHPQNDDLRFATSDETGNYRLEKIGSDEIEIVAEAEGFGPGYFGELLGWGRAVPVEVESGETVRGIDIALRPASYVRGRIVDESGRGLEGLEVLSPLQTRFMGGVLSEGGRKRTDAEGRFEIGPLGLSKPTKLPVSLSSSEYSIHLPEQEAVEPGDDLDLGDLVATRRATVRGRVETEKGEPITGEGTVATRNYGTNCRIRPDGTFELPGLSPGKHQLRAWTGGEPPMYSEFVDLEIEGGRDVDDLVLVVQPTYVVSGVVLTSKGTPRSGKQIVVVPEGTPQPIPWTTVSVYPSQADGSFKATRLLKGRYLVGMVTWGDGGWVFEEDPKPQLVEAGTTGVELRVEIKGGLVRGVVLSKANGQPVEKFEVDQYKYKLIFPDWEGSEDVESSNGTFQLEVEQPGRWAFEVSAPGFAPLRSAIVTIKTGEETDLGEIRLGQAGGVHGRITDHEGHGVGWTRIHLLNAKLQTNWSPPYTNPSGRYELKGVAPGTYTVFAVSPRHPLAMVKNVVVKEAVSTRVDVEFKGSAPLTIRVLDDKGQPLPGAQLIWTFPELRPFNSKMAGSYEPPGYGSNVADESGIIRKPYLPAGPVDLEIGAKGFRPKKQTVELSVGEAKEIEIRLDLERS